MLVGVEPVGAGAVAGGEAHAALVGVLHFLYHNAGHLLEFVGAYIEVEFVVHLQNHLRLDVLLLESTVDVNHGNLDDVGSGALDGRVDGIALAEAAHHGIARVDVGQHASAAVERGNIAFFLGLCDAAVDVGAHLRESLEVAVAFPSLE